MKNFIMLVETKHINKTSLYWRENQIEKFHSYIRYY
jgi:Holliday junction resolvase